MDQIVRQTFQENGDSQTKLRQEIEMLIDRHGDEIYREAFRHLFKRDIDAPRAGRYWREALTRWSSMALMKGGMLRVRSTLLDYLHGVFGESLSSATNGLTGLYHWAYARQYSNKLLAYLRCNGGAPSLALRLFELNHIHRYSELRGPLEGDRELRSVVKIIGSHTRGMDVSSRHENSSFAWSSPARTKPGPSLSQPPTSPDRSPHLEAA